MAFGRPSFALGVLLAAAIPYAAVMIVLLSRLDGLSAEAHAFGQFAAVIIGFVGLPAFLILAVLVFGFGRWALQRSGRTGIGAYVLWGASSGLSLLGMLLILPPRQSLSGLFPAALLVAVVGASAGAAFWLGALRARKN